ncbi:hypothetical protein K439DRAFT_1078564 [Ramaria rubella]|nr:hypothetical protein K439DRAFT_1078564 [Ramaria rubella]
MGPRHRIPARSLCRCHCWGSRCWAIECRQREARVAAVLRRLCTAELGYRDGEHAAHGCRMLCLCSNVLIFVGVASMCSLVSYSKSCCATACGTTIRSRTSMWRRRRTCLCRCLISLQGLGVKTMADLQADSTLRASRPSFWLYKLHTYQS